MRVLQACVVALALAFAGAQPVHAQEQASIPQYEALMRWARGHQQIIQALFAPLQAMPNPQVSDQPAERTAWVAQARTWVSSYRAQIQDVRGRIVALGPVPDAAELSRAYRHQSEALPALMDSLESFLSEYDRVADAIERNDPQAWALAAISGTDAQILIMTQFRDINSMQAETMSDEGPQRHLLRSFAASYDSLILVLRERRSGMLGGTINPVAVAQLRATVDTMREQIRLGRVAAVTAEGELPAQVPPDQSDFLRRARLAYQSFAGSFDREERIATHLAAVAEAMSTSSSFPPIEGVVSANIVQAGQLDRERLVDIQRRTQLVQTVVPPT